MVDFAVPHPLLPVTSQVTPLLGTPLLQEQSVTDLLADV